MKIGLAKSINLTMAIRWIIFLPIILPLCIVFGALKGIMLMIDKMTQQMLMDIELDHPGRY